MAVLDPQVPAMREALLRRRRSRRRVSPSLVVAGTFLGVLVLVAIVGPQIAPANPYAGTIAERLLPVGSPGHLLGTDGQGRDILSRLIVGTRPTLLEGIVPVMIAGCVGAFLGLTAGLARPALHTVIMRSLDVLYAFPAVLLAITVATPLGPGALSTIVAVAVVFVAPVARITNTEVLRIRHDDFMAAATASGGRPAVILLRQVLPCVFPTLLVYCTTLVGWAIIIAGGLSILGLGIAPPHPEWGAMLNDLQTDLYNAPALALVPACAIFVTSLAFNVFGSGLRTLLDVHEMQP